MEKCSGVGQATDGTMAHAHCMLDGACALHAGYPRLQTTVGICNSYFFPTTTMVARTRLSVTFTYIAFVRCIMYSGILGQNINNIQAKPGGGVDDCLL